ncbi:MAG: NUDIX domain-containing protein [Oscillospiraceae bacterium]|nr:NUDIX domain-containing protein [Oscillospiraceae bacterium]
MQYGNTEVFLTPEQREELIGSLMGKRVEVMVDRPIGFVHVTKGVTLHYTINYGYIPGVLGGDGEEQDVYILGVDRPLECFTGRIIAAIRRRDDNEDKLVAAPEGMLLHQAQIGETVHFVEKYFDSTIDSLLRKSCGVIPYRDTPRGLEVLLLLQSNGCWSFPKGHMDVGEAEEETALRETREETGLEAVLHPGFREKAEYPMGRGRCKQLVLFLGQVSGEPEIEEREIRAYRWMSFREARELLLEEQHPILDRAEACLREERT